MRCLCTASRAREEQYYRAARKLKGQIERAMKAEARHLGIRRIQELFEEKAERMYQWAEDRPECLPTTTAPSVNCAQR